MPERLVRRALSEDGQGLVELLIALTMLAIAVGALIAVLVAGAVALQRSDQKGTAVTLADTQLEVYRTFTYPNVRLTHNLPGAGTTYASAYLSDATIPQASSCTAVNTPSGCIVADTYSPENACTAGEQACVPSQNTSTIRNGSTTTGSATVSGLSQTSDLVVGTVVKGTGIPPGTTIASITNSSTVVLSATATASGTAALTFNPAPDGRRYEIDTYITYYTPASGVTNGAKQVLVVVRDPTRTGSPILARASTTFQKLTVATS